MPLEWGAAEAFPKLELLNLAESNISGTLPPDWAFAFPNLMELILSVTEVHGTIPQEWAVPEAFEQLRVLSLGSSNLHGTLPAFNNSHLRVLWLNNASLNDTLDAFWGSEAPIQSVFLQNNSIHGFLPDDQGALSDIAYIDLRGNHLQGTVPISWLQEGKFLSHVYYVNVGQAWETSEASNAWRQQVCLQKDLYNTDVTGQQLAEALKLPEQLLTPSYLPPRFDVSALEETLQVDDRYILGFELQLASNNQLSSVKKICANRAAAQVLLIVWLSFAASCLLIVAVYAILQKYTMRGDFRRVGVRLCRTTIWSACLVFCQAVSGLVSLAFYYYDLITGFIVLYQVWGTWPGHLLTGIFIFHFAMTAEIVLFHAVLRMSAPGSDSRSKCACSSGLIVPFTLLASPFMIPLILLLDSVALARQVFVCAKQLPGCRSACTVEFAAEKAVFSSQVCRLWGFDWIDLDSYDSMHNLVAAVCQSLPTVILYSVLFFLGNEPSHGLFLSTGLFIVAIIASCLAVLKVLVVTLWEASEAKANPAKYAAKLFLGTMLAVETPSLPVPKTSICLDKLTQQYVVSGSPPLGDPCPADNCMKVAPHLQTVEVL